MQDQSLEWRVFRAIKNSFEEKSGGAMLESIKKKLITDKMLGPITNNPRS